MTRRGANVRWRGAASTLPTYTLAVFSVMNNAWAMARGRRPANPHPMSSDPAYRENGGRAPTPGRVWSKEGPWT